MECFDRIRNFPGEVGFYCRYLGGDKVWTHNPDLPLRAASVIKLPVMVTAMRDIASRDLDPDRIVRITPDMKLPDCGALSYMHDGLEVTVMDLITLMIILSDNAATNILIDMLGTGHVNKTMEELDIPGVSLLRKLYDYEMSAKGITNRVTARGIGLILERIASGTLLGKQSDDTMLRILSDQQLNGKIPFYLGCEDITCAHKTGEDTGITHDVGIVFAEKPFVICMLSNHVNVPEFERLIQDTAKSLAHEEWL